MLLIKSYQTIDSHQIFTTPQLCFPPCTHSIHLFFSHRQLESCLTSPSASLLKISTPTPTPTIDARCRFCRKCDIGASRSPVDLHHPTRVMSRLRGNIWRLPPPVTFRKDTSVLMNCTVLIRCRSGSHYPFRPMCTLNPESTSGN